MHCLKLTLDVMMAPSLSFRFTDFGRKQRVYTFNSIISHLILMRHSRNDHTLVEMILDVMVTTNTFRFTDYGRKYHDLACESQSHSSTFKAGARKKTKRVYSRIAEGCAVSNNGSGFNSETNFFSKSKTNRFLLCPNRLAYPILSGYLEK